MEFLYPISRQFPVDEVCEQIMHELQRRNYQVPGLKVELDDYGRGEERYRMVRRITHVDFRLWFCRKQRQMPSGEYNDTAAVTTMVIPRKELSIYEDESGPSLNIYVGHDYEGGRHAFMHGSKVNSKLNRQPRTYLSYKAGCDCEANRHSHYPTLRHTHPGNRAPILVHDNDLGREYEPIGDEPRQFKTEEVLEEFRQYLESVVLPLILETPLPEIQLDPLAMPDTIPYPENLPPLFCFAESQDVQRIKQGQVDPAELIPADRYALSGGGKRLMPLGTRGGQAAPEIAYEGFRWCAFGEITPETENEKLEVPGHSRWDERFALRVTPNRANEIYIADHAKYEDKRREIAARPNNRDRFTDGEVDEMYVARAVTIVPITEYQGNYETPIILINRELDFDEVEVVSEAKRKVRA